MKFNVKNRSDSLSSLSSSWKVFEEYENFSISSDSLKPFESLLTGSIYRPLIAE